MSDVENEVIVTQTEEEAASEETTKKSKTLPTQTLLVIRALIGGYVLYLAYGLITSKDEKTTMIYVFTALFLVAGILLISLSIKHFICGEFEGGKADDNDTGTL